MSKHFSNLKNQQGVSIVSLMISVVISLIGVAASFQLFTTMLIVDNEHDQIEKITGRSTQLKINLEMDILEAGFGMDNNIKNIGKSADGTQIHWRYKENIDDPDNICTGIEDKLVTGQRVIREILATCTDDSVALNTLTWRVNRTLATLDQSKPWLNNIEIDKIDCWPYSSNGKKSRNEIKINYQTIQPITDVSNFSDSSLCLINAKN